jgi:hypothetical protein
MTSNLIPGPVVLFGSGETSPSGKRIFDHTLARIVSAGTLSGPPKVALLETPAGFELNSAQVIQRVADFLTWRLQNYQPQTIVVPARKKGTPYSPDDADITAPLQWADMIFMGPGSPSFAVRQLKDSLAWQRIIVSHRLGSTLVLASAATVAISAFSLPVYEIYKVGEELHWKPGLDFFALYGVPLVFIPHWNNQDGGSELDTSRCYMGRSRFTSLIEILPSGIPVVGIDEKTALILDLGAGEAHVLGLGGVQILLNPKLPSQTTKVYKSRSSFSLQEIGDFRIPEGPPGLPADVWQQAVDARAQIKKEVKPAPPKAVTDLVSLREAARERRDWQLADKLRDDILELGWTIKDTSDGPAIEKGSD